MNADVNLDVAPYNEGSGWEPIGTYSVPFKGSFDGNSHVITGLKINRSNEDYVGLFGRINSSQEIKNVRLENVSIAGRSYVGALTGQVTNTRISHSYVSGSVASEGMGNHGQYIGGLIGLIQYGTYTNNKSEATVTGNNYVGGLIGFGEGMSSTNFIMISDSSATGSVTGSENVGGLIGSSLRAGTLIDSFATGNVNGKDSVGGLIGSLGATIAVNNPGKIERSFAIGNVEGTGTSIGGLVGNKVAGSLQDTYARGVVKGNKDVGGLVGNDAKGATENSYATGLVTGTNSGGLIGTRNESASIVNSYYDQLTTGKDDTGKGTGKTTAEMKTKTTFTNWNFTNIWTIPDGEYPRFLKAGEVGTEADVIYVKEGSSGDGTSWENAFGTLQEALAVESGSKQIWIAAGTYIPTGNIGYAGGIEDNPRSAHFQMQNGVKVYGGFNGTETELSERDWEVNKTVLSGDLNRNDDSNDSATYEDNAYNVFYHPANIGLNATAILDGVTVTAGNANLTNSTFNDGGAMNNYTASPTLKNITFEDNQSTRNGGAISNRVRSNPTFENVIFRNNTGTNSGGGMYNNASSVVLTDAIFTGNETEGSGGGIRNEGTGTTTITGGIFENNSANYSGGGMYNGARKVHLTDVNFIENSAVTESGGGLYLAAENDDTLTNVTLLNNIAKRDGGGIYNDKGTLTLTNGTFEGNEAQGTGNTNNGGGGLFDNNSLRTELKDVRFEGNTTNRSGGGVYTRGNAIEKGQFILNDGVFHNNTANMNGGGLYAANSDTTMKSVAVTENKTTYASSGFNAGGAGIATSLSGNVTLTLDNVDVSDNTSAWDAGGIQSGTLDMKNSTVSNNKARSVGGLSFTQGSIKNTTIDGNETTGGNPGENTGGDAGGVLVGGGETLIEDVTISNNQANGTPVGNSVINGNGGGVYISNNAKAHLLNVKIQGNSANRGGGGFSNVNSTGHATLTNVLMTGNSATLGGGWKTNKKDEFNNVTITNNSASLRGGGIDSDFSLNINNSIVWENRSDYATHDEICTGSTASNSTDGGIQHSFNSSLIGSLGSIEIPAENGNDGYKQCDEERSIQHNGTSIDPFFNNASLGDYRLSAGSPAIDTGNNNLIPEGVTTDLQGISRIIDGTVDIGAFEYREPTADKEIRSITTEVNDQTVDMGTERSELNLPNKVDVTLDDGTTDELGIEWDDGDPSYNKDVAGNYEFTGTLQLGSNIVNPENLSLRVTITVKEKEVVSIQKIDSLNQITVNRGVEKSELNLPEKVNVQLSDGTEKQLAVTWNNGLPEFVQNKPGTNVFSGTLSLVDDIKNSANLKASIKVEVQQSPFIFTLNDAQVVYANDLIQIKDRLATLKLPNDLPNGTKLEIKPVTTIDIPAGLIRAGDALEFLFTYPAGSTNYTGDFKLTLGVDNGMDPEKMGVYHYDETEKTWTYIDGRGKIANDTITVNVEHFSTYGVLADIAGPTDVTVTEKAKTKDSVTIKFIATDPSGVAKYVVYDNEDKQMEEVVGETGEFTQNDLKSNTSYVYKVVAVDTLGNESEPKEVTITTEQEDSVNPEDPEPIAFIEMDKLDAITVELNSPGSYYPTLAEKVTVYTSDGNEYSGKIKWQDNIHYDYYKVGTYEFTGTVTIEEITVTNSEDMIITQKVIIIEEQNSTENPKEPTVPIELIEIELDSDKQVEVTAGTLIVIQDTNASVLLPEDLPEGTMLRVESVDVKETKSNVKQAGEMYNFIFTFPEGFGFDDVKGQFVLTLGIDDDADEEKVAIYHYNEKTKQWDYVGGEIEDRQISVTIEHFSIYGVFIDEKENETDPKNLTDPSEPKKSTYQTDKKGDGKRSPMVSTESDNTKDVKVTGDYSEKSETDKRESLPKTATNYYTFLFVGLLFIVIGGGAYFILKKRRTSEHRN